MNSIKDEVMDEEVPQQKLAMKIHRKSFSFHLERPLHKWSLIPESKLIFIIRTSARLMKSEEVCRTSRKLLQSLRLSIRYTGVFVKADENIMVILPKLKPHVTYGYPSLQTVKLLICNLGAIKLDNKITRFADNPSLVEQVFGQYNISCIEDIVKEIADVGSHFEDVSKALFPFILPKPKGRKPRSSRKKRHGDGGDARIHEDRLNELIGKLKITALVDY